MKISRVRSHLQADTVLTRTLKSWGDDPVLWQNLHHAQTPSSNSSPHRHGIAISNIYKWECNVSFQVSCHKLGEDVIAYFEAYLPSGNKCGQQKPITGDSHHRPCSRISIKFSMVIKKNITSHPSSSEREEKALLKRDIIFFGDTCSHCPCIVTLVKLCWCVTVRNLV